MPDPTNTTNIASSRVPLVDPDSGLITREWFRFFNSLFRLTGGGENPTTLQDVQIGPDNGTDSGLAVVRTQLQDLAVSPTYTPQVMPNRYGTFIDTTTQTAAVINTAYAITFNTTQLSNGVTVGTPTSRIYVDRLGEFNIQFSAQLNKTTATAKNVYIWVRVNGTDLTNSATLVTLAGSSAAAVAARNFVLELNAGSYFELMWSTNDIGCQITTVAAASPVPAIPSIILTVTDNIRI